jgi:hypothetical protein
MARQSFYHYLKNLCRLDDILSVQVINQFFITALSYTHWRENRAFLADTVMADLGEHCKRIGRSLEWNQIETCKEVQFLSIENPAELLILLEKRAKKILPKHSRYQLIPMDKGRALQVTLQSSGELHAQVFTNLVRILRGELIPLLPETHLSYNAQMELKEGVQQVLTTSLMGQAHFQMNLNHATGVTVTGFTLQKSEDFSTLITQKPELFYPIKTLERHFIKAESDPFYAELTRILEKSQELLNTHHPDAEKISIEALKRGRMALKSIFPNDKLLHLLISNLELSIRNRNPGLLKAITPNTSGRDACPQLKPISQLD